MNKDVRPFYRLEGMTKEEELFDETFTDKIINDQASKLKYVIYF